MVTTSASSVKNVGIFHEKQTRLRCAMHCLNNLYQDQWMNASKMDAIASRLTQEAGLSVWSSPYRSIIPGLGQYDVMVIVESLKLKGAKLAHHTLNNAKVEESLVELKDLLLKEKGVKGIIVNVYSTNVLMRMLIDGRHWLPLVPIEGAWYDLDSKISSARPLGNVDQMLDYLKEAIVHKGGQAFLVVSEEEEETR